MSYVVAKQRDAGEITEEILVEALRLVGYEEHPPRDYPMDSIIPPAFVAQLVASPFPMPIRHTEPAFGSLCRFLNFHFEKGLRSGIEQALAQGMKVIRMRQMLLWCE